MNKPRSRPKPLADLLPATLGPALAKQGFSGADIVVSWPDIVGERIAAASQPIRIEWPRRPRGGAASHGETATLVIRVEGAFALELQHLAPIVIERVNSYYGWRCVGRCVLKQGPVTRGGPRRPSERPNPDAAGVRRVEASIRDIVDPVLKDALGRLGRAALDDPTPAGGGLGGLRVPQSEDI